MEASQNASRGSQGAEKVEMEAIAMSNRKSWETIGAALAAPILMTVALVAPAAAQGTQTQTPIQDVEVAVWDSQTKGELATLEPGETLHLNLGQSVLLRVFAPATSNPANERQYLSARFEVQAGKDRVELTQADEAKGSVLLTARESHPGRGRSTAVRYELLGNPPVARGNLVRGAIPVAVEPAAATESPLTAPARAEELVGDLYRGILLREPDQGARQWVDRVASDGYPGLLEVAEEIASSRESQIGVYEKGSCNQARLLALYEHLLGREAGEVDERTWKAQLERLGQGDIAEVVVSLVRSTEFREAHELTANRRSDSD